MAVPSTLHHLPRRNRAAPPGLRANLEVLVTRTSCIVLRRRLWSWRGSRRWLSLSSTLIRWLLALSDLSRWSLLLSLDLAADDDDHDDDEYAGDNHSPLRRRRVPQPPSEKDPYSSSSSPSMALALSLSFFRRLIVPLRKRSPPSHAEKQVAHRARIIFPAAPPRQPQTPVLNSR